MMNLALIPPQAYWIAIAGMVAVVGVQSARVDDLQTDLARAEKVASDERAARTQAALDHVTAVRKLEGEHATAQTEKDKVYVAKIDKLESEQRAGAATVDRLRGQLAAFTAGGRRPGETDAALAGRYADRLQTVSGLLSEGIGLVEEGRAIVERRDAEVARLVDQVHIDRAACSPTP